MIRYIRSMSRPDLVGQISGDGQLPVDFEEISEKEYYQTMKLLFPSLPNEDIHYDDCTACAAD